MCKSGANNKFLFGGPSYDMDTLIKTNQTCVFKCAHTLVYILIIE